MYIIHYSPFINSMWTYMYNVNTKFDWCPHCKILGDPDCNAAGFDGTINFATSNSHLKSVPVQVRETEDRGDVQGIDAKSLRFLAYSQTLFSFGSRGISLIPTIQSLIDPMRNHKKNIVFHNTP